MFGILSFDLQDVGEVLDACSDLHLECRDKVSEVEALQRATIAKLNKYEHSTKECYSNVRDHEEMILKYKLFIAIVV